MHNDKVLSERARLALKRPELLRETVYVAAASAARSSLHAYLEIKSITRPLV